MITEELLLGYEATCYSIIDPKIDIYFKNENVELNAFLKEHNSGWHKNLSISYPNQENIKRAKQFGKSPGGNIKIHGLKNKRGYIGKFHRWHDWTLGCIAVTNEEMDELYRFVKIGTKIVIKL